MADEQERKVTRILGRQEDAPPMEPRPADPLDSVPWVIEFRVVDTTHILRARVSEKLLIGRADAHNEVYPEVDVSPYAAHVLGVSRQHALVRAEQNRLLVQDLDSANGTYLNGHILEPGRDYRLRHGDKLSLGKLHLKVAFAIMPDHDDKTKETLAMGEIVPVVGKGQHFLVVDDDTDVASVIGAVLEFAGFKVTIVGTAVEAMMLLGQGVPDAVVLEMMLPDMSGVDVVRNARQNQGDKHIPLIVVSGATAGYQMNQAFEAGADMYLAKPIGVEELMQGIIKVAEQMD